MTDPAIDQHTEDCLAGHSPTFADCPGCRGVVWAWLRYPGFREWSDAVRAPGEVKRAIGLTMSRRSLSFTEALLAVVQQGSVFPVALDAAVANLGRFEALLSELPPDTSSPQAE